jgi:uncharacterized protein (TIGR03435 family)
MDLLKCRFLTHFHATRPTRIAIALLILVAAPLPCVYGYSVSQTQATNDGAHQEEKNSGADTIFEVATIKPSIKISNGKLFRMVGRRLEVRNATVIDLIKVAYSLDQSQIAGVPQKLSGVQYDIEALPTGEGIVSSQDVKTMLRALLSSRFQLQSHNDTRELRAYVLSSPKGGTKMNLSAAEHDPYPHLSFQGLGVLDVKNATMAEFTQLMQSAVLDRPVMDQTNLSGRYDFKLRWTPDTNQGPIGSAGTAGSDSNVDAPSITTAIREQLGLSLDTRKEKMPVMVVDAISEPSAN